LYSNQPNSSTSGSVTNGIRNIAIGNYSQEANTTGLNNTSVGHETLNNNTTGFWNNAFGMQALLFNTTGVSNVAIGNNSMRANVSGDDNVAVGIASLTNNTSGTSNTAIGYAALNQNSSGTNNTAVGHGAGSVNNFNNYCTFIGVEADQADGTNYTASTAIGYNSRITASSQVRIGNSTTGSIGGYAAWSNLSDGRFKKNIKEDVKGLDFIMALRPVTYNLDIDKLADYMKEDQTSDASGNLVKKPVDPFMKKEREEQSLVLHTGFVAQEVDAAATKLNYKFSGVDKPKNVNDVYALRYSEFVVPLVKGMQEQQNEIKALKEKIDQLEKLVQQLLPGK
jgi:trimeric autotransporter adhesin